MSSCDNEQSVEGFWKITGLTPEELRAELRGKRVTLMGLGTFGGGTGALRFLLSAGAQVTVTDLRSAEQLGVDFDSWKSDPPVVWHLGEHLERDFIDTDLVVASPAVPPHNKFLQCARCHRVPVTTEICLFWQCNPARVVAVTGSNGKSTTTALIHSILKADGRRVWLGGNIGQSLLPCVDRIRSSDWVVLELASFQLHYLNQLRARPNVAVVTNFSPNHLDWHRDLESYRSAKQAILRWQTSNDLCVLNQDDSELCTWPAQARRLWFGTHDTGLPGVFAAQASSVVRVRLQKTEHSLALGHWLRLPGRHNFLNALAAVCAALSTGASWQAVQQGVSEFRGLPHRLEFVAEVNGIRFYNDSLATTPESAIAALHSFGKREVILLAGGYDKGVDLSSFAAAIVARAKAVALLGQTASKLCRQIQQHACHPEVHSFRSFEPAFQWAVEQARAGDVVLLSPGCASYDWFSNFAERGERFRQAVDNLKNLQQQK